MATSYGVEAGGAGGGGGAAGVAVLLGGVSALAFILPFPPGFCSCLKTVITAIMLFMGTNDHRMLGWNARSSSFWAICIMSANSMTSKPFSTSVAATVLCDLE